MKIKKNMIKENIIFHCSSKEKAIELLQKCHELGYKWWNGGSYLEHNIWKYHKEDTCYYIHDGIYGSIEWHKFDECDIIEYILDNDCKENSNKKLLKELLIACENYLNEYDIEKDNMIDTIRNKDLRKIINSVRLIVSSIVNEK